MGTRPSWPHSTPFEAGIPEIIRPADPAAGAEWTQTVPANTFWLILLIRYQLVSDATAAQRHGSIAVNDGAGLVEIGQPGAFQAASLARLFTYQANAPFTIIGGEILGSFPDRFYTLPGWVIQSSTANFQAGDQYSNIVLYVLRWLVNT